MKKFATARYNCSRTGRLEVGTSGWAPSPTQGFECCPAEDQPEETGRQRAENVGQVMGSQINPGEPDKQEPEAGAHYTSQTRGRGYGRFSRLE
jgi:hypothetical protein